MNVSQDTDSIHDISRRDTWEIAISGTFLALIIFLAFSGNVLVIGAIYITPKLRENISHLFIINLSITDLLSALIVMLSAFYCLVSDTLDVPSAACDLICAANYCFIIVSMLTLGAISVERYCAIVYPLEYVVLVTREKVIIVILYTWFQGIVFAVVPVIKQWIQYDYWEVVCAIDWDKEHAVHYVIVACILCFLLPGVVMLVCYCIMIRDIKKAQVLPSLPGNQNQNAKSRANKKIVTSFITLVVIFFICMTPFSITKLLKVLKVPIPGYVNLASSYMEYIASATNPMVYGIFRKDFRKAYKRFFQRGANTSEPTQTHLSEQSLPGPTVSINHASISTKRTSATSLLHCLENTRTLRRKSSAHNEVEQT